MEDKKIKKSLTNQEINRAFNKAVEKAHQNPSQEAFNKIEKYLNLGADINARLDGSRKTAISEAVRHLNKPLFDFLLQHKADINAHSLWADTPLYVIIQKKRNNRLHPNIELFDIEKDFLKQGANPNIKDVTGDTTFTWAMQFETTNLIKLLIKYNAKINEKDRFNWTPLVWAIDRRNFEVIKELCHRGASLVDINNSNFNAFHLAIQRKLPKEYINLLITNSRFDSYDEEVKKVDEQLEKKVIIAYWALEKSNIFPSDVQVIILSHLTLNYLHGFNKKFCRWLVKIDNKDAKNPLLAYTDTHVARLEDILQSTNNKKETALQILHDKYQGDAYIQEVEPLINAKLQQDRIDFMNGLVQEDNLVAQIYEHSKKLLEL